MDLTKVIQDELARVTEEFPRFASAHEGYAVIKEELEEATDELGFLTNQLEILWMHVKDNSPKGQQMSINSLIKFSELLAKEAIQVSAMCHRFKRDVL